MTDRPTTFALPAGRPPSAIAVLRISGPRARLALETMAGRLPEPRRVRLAKLRDQHGDVLDEALTLWFPGPHSETGEDMAELHLHGGRAVIAAVLTVLGALEGLRAAEPGEFTRRAFENGRIDLTAVEGLADLIGADTQAQRRQAFRQMSGAFAERAEAWRSDLIAALAMVEAGIDFSDEADVPTTLLTPALAQAAALRSEITAVLADDRRGERLRDGLVVAIAGPPNAGKSSLLNRIARREAAIVSPFEGTTRDVIEVHLDLEGYPVTLVDTAGIRETFDPIEREGVRRAQERAGSAGLVLWVTDGVQAANPAKSEPAQAAPVWRVHNKIDLAGGRPGPEGPARFRVSALTGEGLAELADALSGHAANWFDSTEPSLVTRARHRQALGEAVDALDRALAVAAGRDEVVAEELRLAARALGRLTGRVDVDDILDVIFRDFCIGK